MARIKKTGLDYFPLDTQFVNNRTVRRIMKHRGDAALAVLINIYCAIYSGQGYYVEASDVFYEDLADNLFTLDTDDVRQIVGLALEYGMFHQGLYSRYGILTSEGIQRQYLFSAKRRSTVRMDGRFCLLPPVEAPAPAPQPQEPEIIDAKRKSDLIDIIDRMIDNNGKAFYAQISSEMKQKYSDFIPKNFGCNSFKKLMDKLLPCLKKYAVGTEADGNTIYLVRSRDKHR